MLWGSYSGRAVPGLSLTWRATRSAPAQSPFQRGESVFDAVSVFRARYEANLRYAHHHTGYEMIFVGSYRTSAYLILKH